MKLLSAALFLLLVFSAAPSSAVDGACYDTDGGDLAVCVSNVLEEDCGGAAFVAGVHCLELDFDFEGGVASLNTNNLGLSVPKLQAMK